jgi:hypothetical protein
MITPVRDNENIAWGVMGNGAQFPSPTFAKKTARSLRRFFPVAITAGCAGVLEQRAWAAAL